jgi:hypothetical protein
MLDFNLRMICFDANVPVIVCCGQNDSEEEIVKTLHRALFE